MNRFNKGAALRIAAVCLTLASIVSPVAWFVTLEKAQARLMKFAMEESSRLLTHFEALASTDAQLAAKSAHQAADKITGGLFDVARIYTRQGASLAEAATPDGALMAKELPVPSSIRTPQATYENYYLQGRWAFRVLVPIYAGAGKGSEAIGYFEGIRVIPEWQRTDLRSDALSASFIAALAALLCGIAIYPLIVRLSAENEREAREVLDSHILLIEALGRAVAKRDSDTGAHNYRVAWISARIGEEFGLSGSAMQSLIAGSLLHDVGKIGIPDCILLKPGALSEDEMTVMRTHVELGEDIVSGTGWLVGAHEVVSAHHEKWSGNGYPRQLAGNDIPLAARIFAVSDVFDALSSKRPYKEPMAFPAVMAIIRQESGRHFDPEIIRIFEGIAEEICLQLQNISEQDARRLLIEKIERHFGTCTDKPRSVAANTVG